MTLPDKTERRLSSWKEIAEYLGWDERTCLRWEKNLGLPVHRIDPKSKRSRVFAYAGDLDRWLAERKGQPSPEDPEPQKRRERGGRTARQAARAFKRMQTPFFVAAAAGVLSLAIFVLFDRSDGPADFKIRGSTLVILDKGGRELWSYDTGVKKLRGEDFYRRRFPYPVLDPHLFDKEYPFLVIRDINSDGRPEVVFAAQSEEPLDMGPLVCFDHRGRRLWTFEPGREMAYGCRTYSNDYYVEVLDVCDLEGDGRAEIITVSNQIPFFPTQVAVLNAEGRVVGEYWHAGRLSRFEAVDLDGDGRKELVFGGKNNEYRKPCLVILDSANVRGGSPQMSESYRNNTFAEGGERRYVLFPRTAVDKIEDPAGDVIRGIQILQNGHMALWTGASNICYEIDGQGQLTAVRLSDGFRSKFNRYQAEGRIAGGELDEVSFTLGLAVQVLYYDGRGWESDPFLVSAGLNETTGGTLKLR
ncbi:MAG: hypothetical protein JW747_00235 [Candidatus Aminicenantes bacterium]|nr:hypothetical protein [Candidatus Aminicenantes bacterium]